MSADDIRNRLEKYISAKDSSVDLKQGPIYDLMLQPIPYGEKAINGVVTQLKSKETEVRQSGQQVADWLGGALLERFSATVPSGLLDILVDHLVERIEKATAKQEERTSGTGPQ
jgi:hypothetical protein